MTGIPATQRWLSEELTDELAAEATFLCCVLTFIFLFPILVLLIGAHVADIQGRTISGLSSVAVIETILCSEARASVGSDSAAASSF